MIIDYPDRQQIPALKTLWKEAFGDEDLFLDAFFETAFSPTRCRCVMEGDDVAAALYWFEMSCAETRLAYLYAVATAAACRGRGLFSALFQDTKEVLTKQGFDGILLVPENEKLAHMYEKFGFFPCTRVSVFSAEAGAETVGFREIGAAEFACLRRQLLPAGGVVQEGEDLCFLGTQCRFWAGEGWLAVGQVHEGKLICPEFLGDTGKSSGFLSALGVPEGRFRTPGDDVDFGHLLPLRERCGRPVYFGLALD